MPHERFDRILEWSSNAQRCHITGILSAAELVSGNWWKQPGISLIVYPDGLRENDRDTEIPVSSGFVEVLAEA